MCDGHGKCPCTTVFSWWVVDARCCWLSEVILTPGASCPQRLFAALAQGWSAPANACTVLGDFPGTKLCPLHDQRRGAALLRGSKGAQNSRSLTATSVSLKLFFFFSPH